MFNRKCIFKGSIFRCYVRLPECMLNFRRVHFKNISGWWRNNCPAAVESWSPYRKFMKFTFKLTFGNFGTSKITQLKRKIIWTIHPPWLWVQNVHVPMVLWVSNPLVNQISLASTVVISTCSHTTSISQLGSYWNYPRESYCWWFVRNPANSPVEVGIRLSHNLQGLKNIPGPSWPGLFGISSINISRTFPVSVSRQVAYRSVHPP